MKFKVLMSMIICGTLLGNYGEVQAVTHNKLNREDVPSPTLILEGKGKTIISKEYRSVPLNHSLQDLITELCKEYDIPENLVYSTMETESDFQPTCESSVGAKGLMQLSEDTFIDMRKHMKINNPKLYERTTSDIWDNENNIIVSIYYLNYLKLNLPDNSSYSWDYILTAYNRGIAGAYQFYNKYGTYNSWYSRQVINNLYKY